MPEIRLLLVSCTPAVSQLVEQGLALVPAGASGRADAVHSVAAAQEWLTLRPADVVLVEDGAVGVVPLDWCRLRAVRPSIELVAIVPRDQSLDAAFAAGADDVFHLDELTARTIAHLVTSAAGRARREQQLVDQIVQLRGAFESGREAFVVLDRAERLVAINRLGRRLTRNVLGREPVIGEVVADHLAPELAATFRPRFETALAGESAAVERRFGDPSGECWYHVTYEPLRDRDGAICGVCIAALDVTERKRAEEAARRREAELSAIVDYTQDWESWIGADGHLIWVSSAVERMTGYTADECLAMHGYPLPLLQSADRERMAALLHGGAGDHVHDVTIRLLRRDGAPAWGSLSSQPVYGPGGQPLGRRLSIRDITARMEAEQASQQAADRYRAMFEYAALGIFQSGIDGRVLAANQTFAHMLGYATADDMTRTLHDVSTSYVDPEMRQHVLATLRSRPGFSSFELQLRRSDGRPLTVNMNVRLVKDVRGRELYVEGFVEDISDRKLDEQVRRQLETRVQQVQKLESLAVLAGGVAHDFNNLLMVILGNASLALIEMGADGPATASIQQIEQAARKAAELTNQMLAYSGGGRFSPQPLALGRLLADMRQLLASTLPWNAQLVFELAPDVTDIRADGSQLRQVILNLVTNAAEALEGAEGQVVLRTGELDLDRGYLARCYLEDELPPGRYVFLEVKDSGAGFDEATKARLFEPFYTTKFMGRGLGLAAVLGIVRAHRAAIHVDSVPGQGSTFRVLFPVSATPAEVAAPAVRRSAPVREIGSVLVVDDDELVRHVTRSMLQKAGFDVVTARDGLEAVQLFEQDPARFGLVLLDLTMPRMDGQAAFQRLRAIRPDARVVLSSGYSEEQARARIPLEGLAGFIQKPYRPQDLLEKLREAVTAPIP